MTRLNTRLVALILLVAITLIVAIGFWVFSTEVRDPQSRAFLQWWRGDEQTRASLITSARDACPEAPFVLPADGFIGLFYGDPRGPYSRSNPHQGIDIFSPAGPGLTPVYAASDGYITRESDWRSSLIQRVPDDPLNPGQQIWLYYTHMADQRGQEDFIEEAFAPGTRELFVEQGTLLGFTGNYSGNPVRPVGVHLHFSIVKDNGSGSYLNELEFANTVDPSPYLSMPINYGCAPVVPGCSQDVTCN